MSGPEGDLTYTYDKAGHVTKAVNGYGETLKWTYSTAGFVASMTYPDASKETYVYNGDGLLTSMAHSTFGKTTFTYTADGQIKTEVLPGGADKRSWTYRFGRLSNYSETLGATTKATSYVSYVAGRVTKTTTGGVSTTYAYDTAGALTSVKGPLATATYAYDGLGNRASETTAGLKTTYVYDAAQQLRSASRAGVSVGYDYDAAGRLVSETAPGWSSRVDYDSRGLAVGRQVTAGAGGWSSQRRYDALGRLSGLDVTSGVSTSVSRLLRAPSVGSGDESVVGWRTGGVPVTFPGRVAAVGAGRADRLSRDGLGSVLATSSTGDVGAAGVYDMWGTPAGVDALAAPVPESVRLGYRGEVTLGDTLDLGARQYRPDLGRFTARDPVDGIPGRVSATNQYVYAENQPWRLVDPTGRSAILDAAFGGTIDAMAAGFWDDGPPRFSGEGAAAWARANALAYRDGGLHELASDCTNFVSHSLSRGGGLSPRGDWTPDGGGLAGWFGRHLGWRSSPWTVAEDFVDYFASQWWATVTVVGGHDGGTAIDRLQSLAELGDAIAVDWDDDPGSWDHLEVVADRRADGVSPDLS